MNIIYDVNTNSLRAVNHKDGNTESLSEINFYIPKGFNLPLYCILRDAFGKENIFKLTPASVQNKNYAAYVISTNNSTINALDKKVQLSLFYFVNDTVRISNALAFDLDYKMYNYASQLSVIRAISQEVAAQYEKVLKLTNLNIDMYKEIEETFEEVNK